ncbi:MAG: SiaB family protein kinase [Alphaproteobacteria bacterium]|nr:SiaB family protein kinase [Alphaproteobacteria bacterium]
MNHDDMKALRAIFERCHIVISFNGPFSQTVIEELGEAIQRHLESQTQPRKRIADVFSVYIETTQNIRHYAETVGKDEADIARLNAGTVLIAREGEQYVVVSGNLVRREDIPALTSRLDAVIALDEAGLKAAYKDRLRTPLEDGASGAGLGFLQMARRASKPLSYSVSEGDEAYSFFNLTATI